MADEQRDKVRDNIREWMTEERYTSDEVNYAIESLSDEMADMYADITLFPSLKSVQGCPEQYLNRLEHFYFLSQEPMWSEEIRRRRLLTVSDFIRIKGTEESFNYWFYYYKLRMSIIDLFSEDYADFFDSFPSGGVNFYSTPHFALELYLSEEAYIIDEVADYGTTPIPPHAVSFQTLMANLRENVKPAETVFEFLRIIKELIDIYDHGYYDIEYKQITEYTEDEYGVNGPCVTPCFLIGQPGVNIGDNHPVLLTPWLICDETCYPRDEADIYKNVDMGSEDVQLWDQFIGFELQIGNFTIQENARVHTIPGNTEFAGLREDIEDFTEDTIPVPTDDFFFTDTPTTMEDDYPARSLYIGSFDVGEDDKYITDPGVRYLDSGEVTIKEYAGAVLVSTMTKWI